MQLQVAGRRGVRLIIEASASSSRACMGLGLNGPKSWALVNGLGLGVLGSALSILGLNLRLRISRIYSKEVSGSLAFRTRIFS